MMVRTELYTYCFDYYGLEYKKSRQNSVRDGVVCSDGLSLHTTWFAALLGLSNVDADGGHQQFSAVVGHDVESGAALGTLA